jgi:hypothetical protein
LQEWWQCDPKLGRDGGPVSREERKESYLCHHEMRNAGIKTAKDVKYFIQEPVVILKTLKNHDLDNFSQ